jgi:hypothetical protein
MADRADEFELPGPVGHFGEDHAANTSSGVDAQPVLRDYLIVQRERRRELRGIVEKRQLAELA